MKRREGRKMGKLMSRSAHQRLREQGGRVADSPFLCCCRGRGWVWRERDRKGQKAREEEKERERRILGG